MINRSDSPQLMIRIIDGFVKSHSAVLHFILRHYSVPAVRFITQDSCALHNELFTLPSENLTFYESIIIAFPGKFSGSNC